MQYKLIFNLNNPLSIRMIGSGEDIKKECAKLEDTFYEAEQERLESIRQDYE